MTQELVIASVKECIQDLNKIIWWTKTIDNPIYDIDEKGIRSPRDLYQIRQGFIDYYNKYAAGP